MRVPAAVLLSLLLPAGAVQAQGLSGEDVYGQVCTACHAEGRDKAPKVGDRKMWAPLIKEGQSKLTADAWLGVRAMPPKGGKPDLGLQEFSRAVAHMARASGASWKDPDGALLANIEKRVKEREAARAAKKK